MTAGPPRATSRSQFLQTSGAVPDVILATKVHMPSPRSGMVCRPRLDALLDAGVTGPLTVVVAPAGWGKTALLAGWLDARCGHARSGEFGRESERAIRAGWLSLDAEDNDIARFLRYLIAAVQTVHPDVGAASLAALRSPPPVPVNTVSLLSF